MSHSVLYVDDSPVDRVRWKGVLSKHPEFIVQTCDDGAAALQLIAESPPDLVLTDLNMPDLGGLQLVQKLAEDHPGLPVVIITGTGSEDIAIEAMQSGAANYLTKTQAPATIIATLRQVLRAGEDAAAEIELMQCLVSDEYSLELPNSRAIMCATASFLRKGIEAAGLCSAGDVVRVGVALEEALLNACLHGNLELDSALKEEDGDQFERLAEERAASEPWEQRKVRVEASIRPEEAVIRISDEGAGFDPKDLPDPTDPENLLKPHGRGVLMMRMFMDNVTWNPRGNIVSMIKRRSTEEAEDE